MLYMKVVGKTQDEVCILLSCMSCRFPHWGGGGGCGWGRSSPDFLVVSWWDSGSC